MEDKKRTHNPTMSTSIKLRNIKISVLKTSIIAMTKDSDYVIIGDN